MEFLTDGPDDAGRTFLFAHGAGGAMDTPFMAQIARGIAARGIRVVRFEFPYMAARRTGGSRRAPDRPPLLLETFREVVRAQSRGTILIGGKSMGGRIASMVADELSVEGLVCLGYPFHPPGAPSKLRTAHLASLKTPALIVQGERDPFGTRDEVAGYMLPASIRVEWLPGGDHSFKPRAASGVSYADNMARAIELAAAFMT